MPRVMSGPPNRSVALVSVTEGTSGARNLHVGVNELNGARMPRTDARRGAGGRGATSERSPEVLRGSAGAGTGFTLR